VRDTAHEPAPDQLQPDGREAEATPVDVSIDAMDGGVPDAEIDAALDERVGSDDSAAEAPPDRTDAAIAPCGCTPQNALDRRGETDLVVSFSCCTFSPKCLLVSAGARVRFAGNFVSHPMSSSLDNDPGGPSLEASSGTEVAFEFPNAGSFGYYCTLHGFDRPLGGMCGAVLVDR
jgi:plastocyanin